MLSDRPLNATRGRSVPRFLSHNDVQLRVLLVVGWGHEIDTIIGDQAVDLIEILLSSLLIVNGDGMAALISQHLHSGDVGVPIAEKDHAFERDRTGASRHVLIDCLIVPVVLDSLVDTK
jgi:hypothetical protein